jgi:uncharacterized membrane protein YkvA (DUF1232 family)
MRTIRVYKIEFIKISVKKLVSGLSSLCAASRYKPQAQYLCSFERLAMFKLGLLLTKFRKELLLVWAMLRDSRTPASAKLVALLAALYVISPFDLVPDVIPLLGWLDDGIVALMLFKFAQRLLPADLLASLKAKLDERGRTAGGTR